jgi:hypothetical protein
MAIFIGTIISQPALHGNGLVTHIDYAQDTWNSSKYTYYGCTSLISVHIKGNMRYVNSVGAYVFASCTNLRSVTMTDNIGFYEYGCSGFGEYAFMNCTSLEQLQFGDNFSSIASTALLNCNNIRTVYLNADEAGWNSLSQKIPNSEKITVNFTAKETD